MPVRGRHAWDSFGSQLLASLIRLHQPKQLPAVRQMMEQGKVNADVMFSAFCAYGLLGVLWMNWPEVFAPCPSDVFVGSDPIVTVDEESNARAVVPDTPMALRGDLPEDFKLNIVGDSGVAFYWRKTHTRESDGSTWTEQVSKCPVSPVQDALNKSKRTWCTAEYFFGGRRDTEAFDEDHERQY